MNQNTKRNVGEVFGKKGQTNQLAPSSHEVFVTGRANQAINTTQNENPIRVYKQSTLDMKKQNNKREISNLEKGRIKTLDRYRAGAPETFHVPPQEPIPIKAIAMIDPDSDLFLKVGLKAYECHMESLIACSVCGRKFFPDRIQRHEVTCAADPL